VPILFFQKSQCNRIRGKERRGCRLGGEERGKEGNCFREQMGGTMKKKWGHLDIWYSYLTMDIKDPFLRC